MSLTSYSVSYSFSGFQANSPNTPLPGQKLDIELYNIQAAIGSADTYITALQRAVNGLTTTIAGIQANGYGQLPIMKHEGVAALLVNSTSGVTWYKTVSDLVPALESDPVNGKWNAAFWPVGGSTWAFIKATLNASIPGGFSDLDLATLQAQALSYRSAL